MLSIILFLIVISAFAVFACFKLDKTFEEALPISCMGIILVLFLFGVLHILKIGAVVIGVAAALLYVYTIYWIIKGGAKSVLKERIFNLVTPGFLIFAAFSMLLAYWNQDRMATRTDEFSHWLDTVVIMSQLDAFGTAPGSTAVFPSYPPAMSLFQYMLEKINMLVTGEFSEWKTYYAYQLLAIVSMLPFAKVKAEATAKKVASIIMWFAAVVMPLYFFSEAYCSLYIDPFLGVLGGCGFAAISLTKNKDWLYTTYISMLCATLTLAKDVGIYLAMFIALYYVIDMISAKRADAVSKIKLLAVSLVPVISFVAAKMLWKLELTISHTPRKFSAPFDFAGTIATLQGKGNEFQTTVHGNFMDAITYRYIYFERMGFNYTALMVLITAALIGLHIKLYRKSQLTKAASIAGAVIPSIAIIFYILSMFPLYISRFSEEEAINLASFDRYCGIMFLTGLLLLTWLVRESISDITKKQVAVIAAVAVTLLVFHSKAESIRYYTSRQLVDDSVSFRAAVNILAGKINANTPEDASILIVGDDTNVVFHPILATIAKPRSFTYSDVYISSYVDESGAGLSEEEFKEILVDNFDYVAIYNPTDNLVNTYAGLFEDSSEIKDLTLYQVDKESGMLSLVQ
ncbi:hypothetical protein [Pseudobutyrivibrio sp. MD2005]|uniref:hypothetical protein n=1 Tax=Pseudobutyrivibrio sp. MD2005 TaxID=1410616 RepID=UPI0004864E36|nr:hypothetical protein [Pseudobutyrivibrio sp. MD2005]